VLVWVEPQVEDVRARRTVNGSCQILSVPSVFCSMNIIFQLS